MALTASQKARRRNYVGASELPALLLGDDFYINAGDLYHRKVNPPEDEPDSPDKAIEAGSRFEATVIDWALDELSTKGRRNQSRVGPNKIIAATLDCELPDAIPLEAKTSGLLGPVPFWDEWGEDGTDQVPPHVLIQVHGQMYATGAQRAYVAAWIGRRGFLLYPINRSEALIKKCVEAAEVFWNDHVLKGVPPAVVPSIDILKAIPRVEGKSVAIEPTIVEEYLALQAANKAAEDAFDAAKARLINQLGDASIGKAGPYTVDYKTINTTKYDHDLLKAKYPEVYDAIRAPSSYRRLYIKGAKKAGA